MADRAPLEDRRICMSVVIVIFHAVALETEKEPRKPDASRYPTPTFELRLIGSCQADVRQPRRPNGLLLMNFVSRTSNLQRAFARIPI